MPFATMEISSPQRTPITAVTTALSIALTLAIASDFLFWGYPLGASVAVWIGAVMCGILFAKWQIVSAGLFMKATAVAVLAALPAIETINLLSLACAAVGVSYAARMLSGEAETGWPSSLFESLEILCFAPFRIVPDLDAAHERGDQILPATNLKIWVVPVVFSAIFLILFASANPMIDNWIAALHLSAIFEFESFLRFLFWMAAACVIWGIIQARTVKRTSTKKILAISSDEPSRDHAENPLAVLFGPDAILRALILFNLLFAMQTGLDATYLWSGAVLPDGLSYAEYAHRGAYPLMLTAALAALFVVVSFGPGRDLENSSLARWLVFIWILQNVALVVSSIARLTLYVEVYALSYWRVAAFIWMGLVAVGLVLILVRIARKRSNNWLVGANMAVAFAVLYCCGFINFPSVIANYNVDHSREVSGTGVKLDLRYLNSLGRHAIPAMLRYTTLPKNGAKVGWPSRPPYICWLFDKLQLDQSDLKTRQSQWRSWTYRDHRLLDTITSKNAAC